MFDYVKHSAPCYRCGRTLTDWQSKSGPCLLERLTPQDVMYFYTSCNGCGAWNEYEVQIPTPRTFVRVKQEEE
jgi:hypothetical protein